MKYFLSLLALVTFCVQVQAQNIEHQIVASQYGEFQVPTIGNGFAFPSASCQVTGGAKNFPAFTVGVPIKVVDSNPLHIEVDTPVAVNVNGSTCSVSMTTTYSHTSFYLTSGTGGLQEALNSGQVTGGANTVILDQQWYALVAPSNPATVISSVHGNTTLGLIDVTTTPYTAYSWNGSSYAQIAPPGSLPSGNGVVKVASSAGELAIPGVDYVVPSGTVALASNLTGTPTLPTGTAGVTQLTSPCDNSIKLATDQFVVACAGTATFPGSPGIVYSTSPSASRNAVAGTDYVVPSGSITGSAASLSASSALPNNTTATTQTTGDNTTKIATDAFVLANTGSGIPATGLPLVGSGSAGTAVAGTPSVNVVIPLSGIGQYITQFSGSSFGVNKLNADYYVDGFNASTYTGMFQAPVAWSSGAAPSYGLCQVATYSGGNYILTNSPATTTPGTNSQIWYPVVVANSSYPVDCAFYTAAAGIVSGTGTVADGGIGATLHLGGTGIYYTNLGLIEPTVGSAGQGVVNIIGYGRTMTTIKQQTATNSSNCTLEQPPTLNSYAFASFIWEGFTVDGNWLNIPTCVYGAQQFTMRDMVIADAPDGSDHQIEFGNASNTATSWVFEPQVENVDLGQFKGFGSGAVVSTTVSGGVPSFTITNGGSGYTSAETKVILGGTSDFGHACGSMGTTTATISGGAITGITSSATGCVSPVYTIVFGGANVSYGYKLSNVSDAKNLRNMTNGGVGNVAGMYISDVGNAIKIYNYHPEATVEGLQNNGTADVYSLQCDTVFQYCVDFEGEGVTNLYTPEIEWNNSNMTGSRDFYIGNAATNGIPGYTAPMAINVWGTNCNNAAAQPGYAHWDSNQGVIDSAVGSESAQLPNFVHVHQDMYCNTVYQGSPPSITQVTPSFVGNNFTISNGAVGAGWNFAVTPGFLSGGGGVGSQVMNLTQTNTYATGTVGEYQFNFQNPTPATSGNNYGSPAAGWLGTYWTGSASAIESVLQQLTLGSGSNPTGTYAFTHAGSSGALTYSFDGPMTVSGSLSVSSCTGCGSSGIANATFTNATTAIGGNACSASAVTVTMTGVATTSAFSITPNADVSGSNGWGTAGGLVIDAWPTSNTLNYKICNQTSGSITPGAVTWNVSAR
jgi:hypothetical protein